MYFVLTTFVEKQNYGKASVDLCVPKTRFLSLRLFLWESQSCITLGQWKATRAQNSTTLL